MWLSQKPTMAPPWPIFDSAFDLELDDIDYKDLKIVQWP